MIMVQGRFHQLTSTQIPAKTVNPAEAAAVAALFKASQPGSTDRTRIELKPLLRAVLARSFHLRVSNDDATPRQAQEKSTSVRPSTGTVGGNDATKVVDRVDG
ncbi:hypothetical protein CC2G_005325 [Coprinopsis cinerea AmutBmut pab1-1]|nr:hypothetical protein CC2G_005325 [Coprinopsis cinerea AmutBmut pab1-1]